MKNPSDAPIAFRVTLEIEKLNWRQSIRLAWGAKIYLYHEKRTGWSGELPIYLFLCKRCGAFSLDYPHGYPETQYLACHNCESLTRFVPWRVFCKRTWRLLTLLFRVRSSPTGLGFPIPDPRENDPCTCGHMKKEHWRGRGACDKCACPWWHPRAS